MQVIDRSGRRRAQVRPPAVAALASIETGAYEVYQSLPGLIAAPSRYPDVKAPMSRRSDRDANKKLLPAGTSSPWNGPTYWPTF